MDPSPTGAREFEQGEEWGCRPCSQMHGIAVHRRAEGYARVPAIERV